MSFFLTFLQISQWFSVIAVIVLATSKIVLSYRQLAVERKLLRHIAIAVGSAFIVDVLVQIYILNLARTA
jgi:hypothetical protein